MLAFRSRAMSRIKAGPRSRRTTFPPSGNGSPVSARDLKASIQYGLAHRAEALAHAKGYSRGLDDARTDRFVGMYVNAYTVDYGETGRRAVVELFGRAHRAGLLPGPVEVSFVQG